MSDRPITHTPRAGSGAVAAASGPTAQLRLLLLTASAVVVGYPVLVWLADLELVLGPPGLLTLLLVPAVVLSSTIGLVLPRRREIGDRPALRLALTVASIAAIAWLSGWAPAVAAVAFVVAVVQIQRTGSQVWRRSGLVITVFALLGEAGVRLDLLPSVIPPDASHLATASVVGFGWLGLANVGLSVAERERAQHGLARTEARMRALMESSRDVLTVADARGILTYVSPAVEQALGYRPHTLVGTPLLDLVDREQRPAVRNRLRSLVEDGLGSHLRLDVLVVLPTGEHRWHEWTARNLLDDPLVEGLVVDQRDITERRLYQEQLAHAAAHDGLTGLPNRAELMRRLATVLPEAGPGAGVAVLFIDLDRFKEVNDTHGHATGDLMLASVAARLQGCLRTHDHLARLGGDEFCVILTEVRHPEEVRGIIERLEMAVNQPVELNGRLVSVGASIGGALTTDADRGSDALFAEADAAMYAVKRGRTPPQGPRHSGPVRSVPDADQGRAVG